MVGSSRAAAAFALTAFAGLAGACFEEPTERCASGGCRAPACCVESCGGVDPVDACVTPPDSCTQDSAPICGCDGLTYTNTCEANAACVGVAHSGLCGEARSLTSARGHAVPDDADP